MSTLSEALKLTDKIALFGNFKGVNEKNAKTTTALDSKMESSLNILYSRQSSCDQPQEQEMKVDWTTLRPQPMAQRTLDSMVPDRKWIATENWQYRDSHKEPQKQWLMIYFQLKC